MNIIIIKSVINSLFILPRYPLINLLPIFVFIITAPDQTKCLFNLPKLDDRMTINNIHLAIIFCVLKLYKYEITTVH